jgi:hypothetical protein
MIVNTTHLSNEKPAVDNLSELESPLNQIHDSQQELIGSESTHSTCNRQNKATISRNSDLLW